MRLIPAVKMSLLVTTYSRQVTDMLRLVALAEQRLQRHMLHWQLTERLLHEAGPGHRCCQRRRSG